jgi:hypothetical protein
MRGDMLKHVLDPGKKDERPQKGCWAPGDYLSECFTCKNMFLGDKRAMECANCAYKEQEENND